jgi:membrane associated rhomboid family serine protease
VAILVFGGIFLLIGLAMATFGGSGLRKWWTIRQMDPNSMAHAERYSSGGEGSNWNTVTKDVETVPFEIEHSGARVAVDPENASHIDWKPSSRRSTRPIKSYTVASLRGDMGEGIDTEWLLEILSLGLLIGAVALSVVVLTRFSEDDRLLVALRRRFVLGVPWGTVIVIVLVYAVYLFVQGGDEFGGPIVVGFRSWSLRYPQGLVFSSFSHASRSHVIGNLLGTLAFAPIAEYAWSHFPRERGSESFGSPRTNPFARIGVFVVAVFLVGLAGALLVPGAVIGFSGVVFAFAGFAVVTRPITAVLAIVGIQVVSLLRRAVLTPFEVAVTEPSVVQPEWANTALQGHLFGLLVGAVLAALLVRSRGRWPKLRYIWFGALVFAVSRSMHALYWYRGADEFLFFRGVGTAGVLVMATLIAVAVLAWERPVSLDRNLWAGHVALGLLLAVVCALSLVGIGYNMVSVTPGDETADGIDVHDYTVTYVENAENRYISAFEVPVVRESLTVNMSGVIVASDRRNAWALDTSKESLAQYGGALVVVGDATWRDTVYINRTEWALAGTNGKTNETYKVYGSQSEESRRLLYSSQPAVAEPVVNGSQVGIAPTEEFYEVFVANNGSAVETARIPGHNESVDVGGITFVRDGETLVAVHERTRLPVATYRTRGQLQTFETS